MSANSTGPGEERKPRWRFEAGPEDPQPGPREAGPGPMQGPLIDRAWLQLLLQHTPFQPVDDREYARLVDRYRELEVLVLKDPQLQAYYAETFLPPPAASEWPQSSETEVGGAPLWKLHHVATLQAQLMEDVFYSFRLDRHANAFDNRGWMNLFRRWGRSKAFQTRFDQMRATFSRRFVDFFDYYVRDLDPIDLAPVPHPWDPQEQRPDIRHAPPVSEGDAEFIKEIKQSPTVVRRVLPGVYLDSGIREAEPWKVQTPHPSSGEHASEAPKSTAPIEPPPGPAEGGPPSGSKGLPE